MINYTQTARFDTGRAMTEDEMRRMAPSIFAAAAHESRSERFQRSDHRNPGWSHEGMVRASRREAIDKPD